jgi:hypothetical protein
VKGHLDELLSGGELRRARVRAEGADSLERGQFLELALKDVVGGVRISVEGGE